MSVGGDALSAARSLTRCRPRGHWAWLAVVALAATLLLAACGEEEAAGDRLTPTPSVATPTTPPSADIRDVDFSGVADVRQAVEAVGGDLSLLEVVYGDLTGDGADEAVVLIPSGGTMGNIGFLVYTMEGSDLRLLLDRLGIWVAVEIEGKQLIQVQPLYSADDPECCPSQLKRTYYEWDGSALVVDREETVDNPDVGPKPDSAPR